LRKILLLASAAFWVSEQALAQEVAVVSACYAWDPAKRSSPAGGGGLGVNHVYATDAAADACVQSGGTPGCCDPVADMPRRAGDPPGCLAVVALVDNQAHEVVEFFGATDFDINGSSMAREFASELCKSSLEDRVPPRGVARR
jgi:hypothetical protein